MSRYLYKKIQNISPESLNFQHSGLKLTTLGRDADALTAAFTEYTSKKVKKAEKTERPSVLAKLSQFKEMVKNAVVDRTKRKELER